MNPFIAAQIHALNENIHLLEAFVTTPVELSSEIRLLRESLPVVDTGELPQLERQQRHLAYHGLTAQPLRLALKAATQIYDVLGTLTSLRDSEGLILRTEWVSHTERVIARVLQQVGRELRSEATSRIRGLYVIIDPDVTAGRSTLEIASAAIEGGAQVLQYRDKTRDAIDVLSEALKMRALCQTHDVLFIMNDNPALAAASEADGLHVGQRDLPVREARRSLGWEQLVGRSNNSMKEVCESMATGADYLAVGTVFPTSTMGKSTRPIVGPELITQTKLITDQPVVAIGGLNTSNVAQVVAAGANCVCVVGAVTLSANPFMSTKVLVEAIENAKNHQSDR